VIAAPPSQGSSGGAKAVSAAAPSRTGYHSPRSAGVAAAPQVAADGTPTVGDGVTHAAGGTPVLLGGAADPRLPPLLSPLFALEREKKTGLGSCPILSRF
jgi:hypothetical protein